MKFCIVLRYFNLVCVGQYSYFVVTWNRTISFSITLFRCAVSSSTSMDYALWPISIQNYLWTYESVRHLVPTPCAGDQPDARSLPVQDSKTQKDKDKHLCLQRDSNPRPLYPRSQDRRLSPRGHWSAGVLYVKYSVITIRSQWPRGPRRGICSFGIVDAK
jgi:hypothetical protein